MKSEKDQQSQIKFLIDQIKVDSEKERSLGYQEVDKKVDGKTRQRLVALAYALNMSPASIINLFDSKDQIDLPITKAEEPKPIYPPENNNTYGHLTSAISQVMLAYSKPFTSGDIYEALRHEFPSLYQSSISTTLSRMAVKGWIKEVGREGRKAFYEVGEGLKK